MRDEALNGSLARAHDVVERLDDLVAELREIVGRVASDSDGPVGARVSGARSRHGGDRIYTVHSGHWSVGQPCPARKIPFVVGNRTTVVPLGPGADPEGRERARAGRPHNAVALVLHYACVTGIETPAPQGEAQ